MGAIIGIDLGTSTTEAAVFRNGKPEMILTAQNSPVVPSVVGIDDDNKIIIGEKAKDRILLEPEKTVIEIKRRMGVSEQISLGKNKYTPAEISSMLLTYVRQYASEYLGEDITKAVISVPAYFNEIQRRATQKAGRLAGFSVERIINEPTAAALSYGIEHMKEESHILIYDLGGGTFDVTLLEMFDGVLEVKASCGDNQLGGKDFDEALMDWLADRFQAKHNLNLRKDIYAMVKLKEAAEKCKIALSTQNSYQIQIPFIIMKKDMPLALEETVMVEQFEALMAPFLERTHAPIQTALADGKVSAAKLKMILLVGGSTRMPCVHKDIEQFLGKKPEAAVDPDFAVAQGAAVQAAIMQGLISAEKGLVMTDVNPFTLGIRTVSAFDLDHMSVMIPRNVTIPVRRKEIFHTSYDQQPSADIEVYQGEFRTASKNHFLGRFRINGIPRKKAGVEGIEVEFSYDLNGMLKVKATILSTGNKAAVRIDMTGIAPMEGKKKDVSGWKNAKDAKEYRMVLRRAEIFFRHPEIPKNKKEELEELIYLLKKAILEEDDKAKELEAELINWIELYS